MDVGVLCWISQIGFSVYCGCPNYHVFVQNFSLLVCIVFHIYFRSIKLTIHANNCINKPCCILTNHVAPVYITMICCKATWPKGLKKLSTVVYNLKVLLFVNKSQRNFRLCGDKDVQSMYLRNGSFS